MRAQGNHMVITKGFEVEKIVREAIKSGELSIVEAVGVLETIKFNVVQDFGAPPIPPKSHN